MVRILGNRFRCRALVRLPVAFVIVVIFAILVGRGRVGVTEALVAVLRTSRASRTLARTFCLSPSACQTTARCEERMQSSMSVPETALYHVQTKLDSRSSDSPPFRGRLSLAVHEANLLRWGRRCAHVGVGCPIAHLPTSTGQQATVFDCEEQNMVDCCRITGVAKGNYDGSMAVGCNEGVGTLPSRFCQQTIVFRHRIPSEHARTETGKDLRDRLRCGLLT